LFVRHRQQRIERAAQLEGARVLLALPLEVDLRARARREWRRVAARRALYHPSEPMSGGEDVGGGRKNHERWVCRMMNQAAPPGKSLARIERPHSRPPTH